MGIKDEEMTENKELANWIYYEEGDLFYCSGCIEKRLAEINENKEFSSEINYEAGDKCGYFQDYADTGGSDEAECCKCGKKLLTIVHEETPPQP